MPLGTKKILPSQSKVDEAVALIKRFQSGEITPIDTGNEWINRHALGGLLPGTILTIGGMSNHGKTHLMSNIESHILSTQKDVKLIRCNWESNVYKLIVRRMKAETGMKMSEILFNEFTGEEARIFEKIISEERSEQVMYMEEPEKADVFLNELGELLQQPEARDSKVLVSIDHVGLTPGREKAAQDALFESMNALKKSHPFLCFLPLIQMRRDGILQRIDNPNTHYPQQVDFYGTDQLFQLSDLVLAVFQPARLGIQDRYMLFKQDDYEYLRKKDLSFFTDYGTNSSAFVPEGNIFYHAVKSRDIDDLSDFQGVWVEQLYEKKDSAPTPSPSVDIFD
jgi:archaellum biogenesis ATPase FlaH